MILRRLARPLLASVFISSGIDTLRNPAPRVEAASPLVEKTVGKHADTLPEQAPTDPETLVKLDAVLKVGAGVALAFGKAPRLASLLLAGSLIPTTVAGHAFWEYEDPSQRGAQRIHFLKNTGLLGGLLVAAVDTEGKPSARWRAKHAAKVANKQASAAVESARGTAQDARETASGVAGKIFSR
jgi:putative oxidoreductase